MDHYGLKGLEERAASIQGDLSVESAPGKGTVITLSVPLRGEEA
jgi:signal transduction histidine kinase